MFDSYRLFLLMFPSQPDDPHRPVTQPLSLKRCPQYWRSGNIRLAYSSSISETTKPLTLMISFYPTFVVYLKMISHLLSFFTPPKWVKDNLKFLRTFWGFPHLFYKGKWFFSFVKHFCKVFLFFLRRGKLYNVLWLRSTCFSNVWQR